MTDSNMKSKVERPDIWITAILGKTEHRWTTTFGSYSGNVSEVQSEVTSDRMFGELPPPHSQAYEGTRSIESRDCDTATIRCEISSLVLSKHIPASCIAN